MIEDAETLALAQLIAAGFKPNVAVDAVRARRLLNGGDRVAVVANRSNAPSSVATNSYAGLCVADIVRRQIEREDIETAPVGHHWCLPLEPIACTRAHAKTKHLGRRTRKEVCSVVGNALEPWAMRTKCRVTVEGKFVVVRKVKS